MLLPEAKDAPVLRYARQLAITRDWVAQNVIVLKVRTLTQTQTSYEICKDNLRILTWD